MKVVITYRGGASSFSWLNENVLHLLKEDISRETGQHGEIDLNTEKQIDVLVKLDWPEPGTKSDDSILAPLLERILRSTVARLGNILQPSRLNGRIEEGDIWLEGDLIKGHFHVKASEMNPYDYEKLSFEDWHLKAPSKPRKPRSEKND